MATDTMNESRWERQPFTDFDALELKAKQGILRIQEDYSEDGHDQEHKKISFSIEKQDGGVEKAIYNVETGRVSYKVNQSIGDLHTSRPQVLYHHLDALLLGGISRKYSGAVANIRESMEERFGSVPMDDLLFDPVKRN